MCILYTIHVTVLSLTYEYTYVQKRRRRPIIESDDEMDTVPSEPSEVY